MFPTLIRLGPIELHSYGLTLALSFLIGIQLALSEARRRGVPEGQIASLALWIMGTAILGARAFYVLSHAENYSGRWLDAFKLWEGGLTLYGGLLAAFLVTFIKAKCWRLPVPVAFDIFTPSLAFGEGLTRLGCFLNGCCFGRPCALPWAVAFPSDSHPGRLFPGEGLHPTQLYLSLAGFVMFALVWLLRKRIQVPGRLFFLYLLLECASRFTVDFLRYYDPDGESVVLFGVRLSFTQLLCLGLTLVAVVGLWLGRVRQAPGATRA